MAKLLIDDLLKLNSNKQSINKIDLFLSNEPKYSDDFMKALAYKAIIMHNQGDTNEALKLLFTYVNDIKELTYVGVIALCDGIINICLDIKRYDQVEKYILLKKDFLPVSKQSYYQKDKIKFLLHQGKKDEAKLELENYIKEDISKDEKMLSIEMLASIYYDNEEFDSYINITKQLINYYKANYRYNDIENIEKNILLISFKKNEYIDFVTGANKALSTYDNPNDILKISSLLILSYIELNDTKKASIVESSYETYAYSIESVEAVEFLDSAIKLYEKFNNEVAIENCEKRIGEIESALNITPKQTKKKKEDYQIPNINIKSIKPKVVTPVISNIKNISLDMDDDADKTKLIKSKQKVVTYKNVLVSSFYNSLFKLIDSINNISLNEKFREFFRQAMIKIGKEYAFDEAYILYNIDNKFKGYHYKLERVYDKKPSLEFLKDSLPLYSYETGEEGHFDNEVKDYPKNVINGDNYNLEYVFSIPLYNDLGVIGSFTYISYTPLFNHDMDYEALKIFAQIINFHLNSYLKLDEINENYEKLNFITKNMPYGIKEEKDGLITLSYQAKEILGIMPNIDTLDYYSHIANKDLANYKEVLNDLSLNIGKSSVIEYEFKGSKSQVKIREYIYSTLIDNNLNYISIIEDITEFKNDLDKVVKLAYQNPISKIDTEVKMLVDIAKYYPNGKLSLAVINIDDFKIYKELYGYNFEHQLIYALGTSLSDNIKSDFYLHLYHLYSDNYVILFENDNDKRVINAKLNKILDNVKKDLHKLNSRLNINFICGVYRTLKNEKISDYSELLVNAKDAINDAEMLVEFPKIAFYDSNLSKARFMDNSLITHISESIDMNLLSLTYKQIVNIKDQEVLAYFTDINLDNYEIDQEKIYQVIKRRNLSAKVLKYIVINAIKEEKIFYNQTHSFLNIFINLNINDVTKDFIGLLKKNIYYYKVRPSSITFIVDDTNNMISKTLKEMGFSLASTNVLDIYRFNIDYFILDYKENKSIAKDIYNLCNNLDIKFILSNINTKDDINLISNEDYKYIYGNYYKRLNRMKDILKKVG